MRRILSSHFKSIIILCLLLSACVRTPAQPITAQKVDATPRLAVVSAFEPEMLALLKQVDGGTRYEINGRSFTTGRLQGRDVVLFLSGVSMVNAAMTTQAAIDHFTLTGMLFSGIAGGVNPELSIGDVVIPAEWAEYQEQVFARASGSGWDTGYHSRGLGNYGMMFPQPVEVTRAGGKLDGVESKVWFAVDPAMLANAKTAAERVTLKKCLKIGLCLSKGPRVVVGGKGVSGSTFVDNAEYRQWVWQTFHADALDMELAAVAHVAYTNAVPFLAFRSLSDLAGGGAGQNEMLTFLQLAADNAASVLLEYLQGDT